MRVLLDNDLVIGITNTDVGEKVDDELLSFPLEQLRFDGTNVVDASTFDVFYIDSKGVKHITKTELSQQKVFCTFADQLVKKQDGNWGVKTLDNLLTDYKDNAYTKFKNLLYQFVTKVCDFPEWKQVNYLDQYYELDSKSNPSSAEQAELTGLKSVRVWKNDLLAYRDTIKSSIYNATSTSNVDSVISNVSFSQPPFDL